MKSVTVRGAQALYFDAGQPAKDDQPNIVFVHGHVLGSGEIVVR